MRRGEVWTLAGGGDFVGKPRPVVVIQDDRFELASATVCPFTTNTTEAAMFRVEIEPAPDNGLEERSWRTRSQPCGKRVYAIKSAI